MTLTTHAVAGAAVASLFTSEPIIGMVAAFASHFLLDSIPHWDYTIDSFKSKENPDEAHLPFTRMRYFLDISKILLDGVLGLVVPLFIFTGIYDVPAILVLSGAAAAMLPDALQFIYWKWKIWPVALLYRFHMAIHAPYSINSGKVGVSLQLALIIAVISASWWLL